MSCTSYMEMICLVRPDCKMYLSQIAKCICLKLWNVFVFNCKMYLSTTYSFLILTNVFVLYWRMYLCTLYFSETPKCICLKWQNLFVQNFQMYLSQVAKFDCLKFKIRFVSNCQIVLRWIYFFGIQYCKFNLVYCIFGIYPN